ncbi:flagellar hook-basal body complex protein FliE [Allosphingosinicella sp.]|uniref:flagellar hook-basal body complex protein FliE n=1 Tax=Allosphingosinicella sp. TaxID=2823234 RepID=UPI003D70A0A2
MAILPTGAVGAGIPIQGLAPTAAPPATPAAAPTGSFSQMLLDGVDAVNQRVAGADSMVRAFTIDDSIPLHQVTFALEQARLSVELMMQVRARLVESYQRVMEMQL